MSGRVLLKCKEVSPRGQRFNVKATVFLAPQAYSFHLGSSITFDEVCRIIIPAYRAMAAGMGWRFDLDTGNSPSFARAAASRSSTEGTAHPPSPTP